MAHVDVWPEPWVESDGQVTVGAVIEPSDGCRQRLWYRVPAQVREALTTRADPFVAGVLFLAMREGGRLTVHGEVSPALLRGLDEFQSAWVAWNPDIYHRVDIAGDREVEARPTDTAATVMMFSGGLDSCFTAWRHRRGQAGRQNCDLRAGIMVHGFDIPLDKQADYDGALQGSRQLLASIGMGCIALATNFRELGGNWSHTHGAGLASCLMLLQRGYRQGLIASSFGYSYLEFPYGSNPLTDGMFSSAAFPVIHDGAGFHRFEKTRAVVEWPELEKYLRVCWAGEKLDRNCCRCQKCMSNVLYFRLLGRRRMECFEHDVTNAEIIWLPYPDPDEIKSMQRILKVARDQHVHDSWVTALKLSVFINQVRRWTPGPVRTVLRPFRRGLQALCLRGRPAS
jgi:hypothetical protein